VAGSQTVFNYKNEFQNPQIFQQTISLFPQHSTLVYYIPRLITNLVVTACKSSSSRPCTAPELRGSRVVTFWLLALSTLYYRMLTATLQHCTTRRWANDQVFPSQLTKFTQGRVFLRQKKSDIIEVLVDPRHKKVYKKCKHRYRLESGPIHGYIFWELAGKFKQHKCWSRL
jgi:hypothetical protein